MNDLLELDGGIHSSEDFKRKLELCFISGYVLDQPLSLLYFEEISSAGTCLIRRRDFAKNGALEHICIRLSDVVYETLRPNVGLYNDPVTGRVWRVSFLPERQWRIGLDSKSSCIENITGVTFSWATNWHRLFTQVEAFYKNEYPTLGEAINLIHKGERKHVAISSKISVLKRKNNIVMLRNFVPFLSTTGSMFFRVNCQSNYQTKDFDFYEPLLRQIV